MGLIRVAAQFRYVSAVRCGTREPLAGRPALAEETQVGLRSRFIPPRNSLPSTSDCALDKDAEELTTLKDALKGLVRSAEEVPNAFKEEAVTARSSGREAELADAATEFARKSEPHPRPLPPVPRWHQDRAPDEKPRSGAEAELADAATDLPRKSEPYARPLPPLPRWLQDRARDKKPEVEAATATASGLRRSLPRRELRTELTPNARPLAYVPSRLQEPARDKEPQIGAEAATILARSMPGRVCRCRKSY